MKTHKVLFRALIVSAILAVSVEAGDRRGNNSRSQAATSRGRSSGQSFSSGSSFRSGGGRMIGPSQRFSSMGARSMPSSFRQRPTFNSGGNAPIVHRQFTPRTFTGGTGNDLARLQNNRPLRTNRFGELQGQNRNRTSQLGTGGRNRTIGNISPGHNHVFAQRSADWNRNWDRHSDHFWNGHRCRWVNNSWFIFDIGFIPWFGWPYYDYYAYDYYPYGYPYYGYGYPSGYGYDSGAYYGSNYYDGNGYDSSYYDQGGYNSSYYNGNRYGSSDESTEIAVADAQRRLARVGYYRGQIDGVLGPETRHA